MLESTQIGAALLAIEGVLPMKTHEVMGLVAGSLAIVDLAVYVLAIFGISYFFSRLRKRTVPNRASWFIWAAIGWIVVASYYQTGATDTMWFPLAYAIGFTIIALLSIKRGEGGANWFDGACVFGAMLAGIGWWWFESPEVGLVASLAVETFAAAPTILKSWKAPSTESKFAWTAAFFASIANLLAINPETATFWIALLPVWLLVLNGMIVAPLYRR